MQETRLRPWYPDEKLERGKGFEIWIIQRVSTEGMRMRRVLESEYDFDMEGRSKVEGCEFRLQGKGLDRWGYEVETSKAELQEQRLDRREESDEGPITETVSTNSFLASTNVSPFYISHTITLAHLLTATRRVRLNLSVPFSFSKLPSNRSSPGPQHPFFFKPTPNILSSVGRLTSTATPPIFQEQILIL